LSKILSGEGISILKKQILRVWSLIDDFKEYCSKSKGWNVCKDEDLIEAENEYHQLIWINHLHPSTFKSVVENPLCSFREGVSYRTIRLSYMAWVLPKTPPESITKIVAEEPRLSKRVAIYDLSEAYSGRPICLRLNETKSVVFHEFEKFLSMAYDVRLWPMYKLPPLPPEFVPPQPEKLGLGN